MKTREKNIVLVLCAAITVSIYFILTQPLVQKNFEYKNEISKLRLALDKPKTTKKGLDKLVKETSELKTFIELLKSQVPNTEKRGFLIRDLEALAKENNIELISFLPKEAISVTVGGQEITEKLKRHLQRKKTAVIRGKVLKTVINIDSIGAFEDYKKLFRDIITYYRAIEIADVTVSKSGAKDIGVDKRFAQKARGDDLLEQYKDQTLSVSFTLYAYTSLENDNTAT